ncbi:MAG TPA: tRNA cytidylyltransferase, partial [Anaeromyxobacteraceae bacterium]|nr:tRNA cytidylyltransferase [Anaeromyxobacteraceae bacterium]
MAPRRTTRETVPPALARAQFAPALLDVLRTLDEAGHRSWLVGGMVRDLLLGRRGTDVADLDVATPARPADVSRLFPKVIPTGIEHGTVTVLSRGVPIEVTTFRGEGPYLDGRRPSSVSFLDDVDGDLARRDFTVNAIAYDPVERRIRDPFQGQRDLRRGVLRAVGDAAARFAEDGLRPLRAVRFAAQLGFRVEPATARAIPPALPVVARVSAERVSQELAKLVVAPHARRALALLDATGLAAVVLPELAALGAADRRHAFDVTAAAPPELPVRLAALFHALARSQGAVAAAQRTREALRRLRFPGQVQDEASRLVQEHGCLLARARPPLPRASADVRRWLARVGPGRSAALLALWTA